MCRPPDPRMLSVEAHAAQCALAEHRPDCTPRRVLNLGFGTGDESASLAAQFSAAVYGIDLVRPVSRPDATAVRYLVSDATRLPFPDHRFDMVYSSHVLEHVGDPAAAVREVRRVLRPGGVFYAGTPNRHRLVGYIGSHDATVMERVRWNLADYGMRLRGRFRNEYGAHAGFSEAELMSLVGTGFQHVKPVGWIYYGRKYPRITPWLARLRPTGLPAVMFPGVYVLAW